MSLSRGELLVELFGGPDVTWHVREGEAKDFQPLTCPPAPTLVEAHLAGLVTLGLGPHRSDDTTRVLVMDFLTKVGRSYRTDATQVWLQARRAGISLYLERLAQGAGVRCWLLFDAPVALRQARRLAAALLVLASQASGKEVAPKSFAGCLPADTPYAAHAQPPIVTLPLGGYSRGSSDSCFVEGSRGLPAWQQPWLHLAGMRALPSAHLDALLSYLGGSDLGTHHFSPRGARDFTTRGASPALLEAWSLGAVYVRRPLPPVLARTLRQALVSDNPEHRQRIAQGRSTRGIPSRLSLCTPLEGGWVLPPEALDLLAAACPRLGYELRVHELHAPGRSTEFRYTRPLSKAAQEALETVLALPRCVLLCDEATEATSVALAVAAHRQVPTLIVVASPPHLERFREEALLWLGIDDKAIAVEDELERGGQPQLGLVTYPYLIRHRSALLASGFELLVLDDCGRISLPQLAAAIQATSHRYCLALAGPDPRRDHLEGECAWYLGPTVELRTLHDDRLLIDVVVRSTRFVWHPWMSRETFPEVGELFFLDYPAPPPPPLEASDPLDRARDWTTLLETLAHDAERNTLVIEDCAEQARAGHRCLVLAQRRDHAMLLAQRLEEHTSVAVLVGQMAATSKRDALQRFRRGDAAVLVATGSVALAVLEVPALNRLFLATPISSEKQLHTLLRPLARPNAERSEVRVYDYCDHEVPRLDEAARLRRRVFRRSYTTLNPDANQLRLPLV